GYDLTIPFVAEAELDLAAHIDACCADRLHDRRLFRDARALHDTIRRQDLRLGMAAFLIRAGCIIQHRLIYILQPAAFALEYLPALRLAEQRSPCAAFAGAEDDEHAPLPRRGGGVWKVLIRWSVRFHGCFSMLLSPRRGGEGGLLKFQGYDAQNA